MQPLAIRLRSARKRYVAESESQVHGALAAAEREADRVGKTALVDFEAANGSRLSVLVGRPDTVLSWRYAGDQDPRFLSLGNAGADGTVALSRDFTDHVDVPLWAFITREDGLAALNEFIQSNDIPECVQWADYPAPGG